MKNCRKTWIKTSKICSRDRPLDLMLHTKRTIQKGIYSTQQKDINKSTSDITSHIQNNKVIHSRFEEKLDKTILNTKQVDTNLSKAYNKATSLKLQVTDSRLDDIN
eukprot:7325358-Ditylum_brightwellii.AAC.1